MPRYINNLLNVARCALRVERLAIEVMYPKTTIITNRHFSCTSFARQQVETATNNPLINNTNGVLHPNEVKIIDTNVNDEDYEWCDVPADEVKSPHALDTCKDDLSDVAQYLKPTFNIAAYADISPTIQELIKLGVELYKLDAKPRALNSLMGRNFEDMKPYIQFLHDCGVPADRIGRSITKNPLIFENDMDDLHTRVRYLRAHNFSRENIGEIITKHPKWLNYDTRTIDSRLAFFQREFEMSGHKTRLLAVRGPSLITYKRMNIWENTLCVREEMGFDKHQVRMILLKEPRVWMRGRHLIVEVFDYVHNSMKIPHDIIARMPTILINRIEIVKSRHEFLKALDRAQYDPQKPLYISLDNIYRGTDYDFCSNVAKTSIELYDMFLKTR